MIEGIWVESAQKSCARLEVTEGYLRLENLETQESATLDNQQNLRVYFGGNNNNLIFVEWDRDHSTVLFYCDRTPQNLGVLKRYSQISSQVENLSSNLRQTQTSMYALLLAIVLGISALVYFRAEVFGNLATYIPYSLEKKLGDKILSKPIPEGQKSAYDDFQKITDVFHKVHPDTYTFHLSSAVEPNAYATIGGHVYVNRGLVMLFENSEELLGVLAHETVHVKQRHVAKMFVQGVGLFAIFQLLVGDVGGIVAVLADQGSAMMNLGYSRELEEEADRMAVQLLVSNGLSPRGLPSGLKKLHEFSKKRIAESPGSEVLEKLESIEMLKSHPNTESRVADLETLILELEKTHQFKNLTVDWKQFQNKVKENF
jgi:Zn-dependent protease with chaperone function